MKKIILVGLLALIVSSISAQNEYDDLRYLVVFQEGTPQSVIDEIREEHEATEIWVSPYSEVRYWESPGYPHYVNNDLIGDIKEEVDRLKNRPVVTGSGLNYDVISFSPIGEGGIPPKLSCFKSFKPTSLASSNTTILSILDTGLTPGVTNSPNYTFSYGDFTGYNYIHDNLVLEDDHGHGTHIAGVASHVSQHLDFNTYAQSDIKFDIRKVFNSSGSGKISDIVYGFDEAVLAGAVIVNMSFAYRSERPSIKQDPLEYCINKAAEDEVLVICAAGNDHINNDTDHLPAYPASYNCDNILSVTSIGCSNMLSDFSNFGFQTVDVAYLGELIPGPSPFGDIVMKSGTSQATAVVSGIATAAASYLADPDYRKVKCAILNTVDVHQSLFGYIMSAGVANAKEAATMPALNSCSSGGSGGNTDFRIQKNKSDQKTEWNVSPNPFENDAMININSTSDSNYDFQILTINGTLVFEGKLSCKKGMNSIKLDDISHLIRGTYFIKIVNENINESMKIVRI